ncbi:hypothetical protein [Deinococcus sp. Marseille-Q6407]|uniref:hypothetical protein n=1 Tax=Deinococcus sp. Marseille-Q6407 TaxID=2969223 RepID=UPI0021C144BC|nr:hypothetical protein [Deinococcus sp. Marseille-Q6407]
MTPPKNTDPLTAARRLLEDQRRRADQLRGAAETAQKSADALRLEAAAPADEVVEGQYRADAARRALEAAEAEAQAQAAQVQELESERVRAEQKAALRGQIDRITQHREQVDNLLEELSEKAAQTLKNINTERAQWAEELRAAEEIARQLYGLPAAYEMGFDVRRAWGDAFADMGAGAEDALSIHPAQEGSAGVRRPYAGPFTAEERRRADHLPALLAYAMARATLLEK